MELAGSRPRERIKPSENSDFLRGPLIAKSFVTTTRALFGLPLGTEAFTRTSFYRQEPSVATGIEKPIRKDNAAIRMDRVAGWLIRRRLGGSFVGNKLLSFSGLRRCGVISPLDKTRVSGGGSVADWLGA